MAGVPLGSMTHDDFVDNFHVGAGGMGGGVSEPAPAPKAPTPHNPGSMNSYLAHPENWPQSESPDQSQHVETHPGHVGGHAESVRNDNALSGGILGPEPDVEIAGGHGTYDTQGEEFVPSGGREAALNAQARNPENYVNAKGEPRYQERERVSGLGANVPASSSVDLPAGETLNAGNADDLRAQVNERASGMSYNPEYAEMHAESGTQPGQPIPSNLLAMHNKKTAHVPQERQPIEPPSKLAPVHTPAPATP